MDESHDQSTQHESTDARPQAGLPEPQFCSLPVYKGRITCQICFESVQKKHLKRGKKFERLSDFIAFAQEEAEKARQDELRMMELLLGGIGNTVPGGFPNQQNRHQEGAYSSMLYQNQLHNNVPPQEVWSPPVARRRIDGFNSQQEDIETSCYYQF